MEDNSIYIYSFYHRQPGFPVDFHRISKLILADFSSMLAKFEENLSKNQNNVTNFRHLYIYSNDFPSLFKIFCFIDIKVD